MLTLGRRSAGDAHQQPAQPAVLQSPRLLRPKRSAPG
jgi:hypothetical protein